MLSRNYENSASAAVAWSAWWLRKPWGCVVCDAPIEEEAGADDFEESTHAEVFPDAEDEGCTFSAPVKAEDEAELSSFEEGAANALRARPVAEDATLLIRVLNGFDDEDVAGVDAGSASFCASARPLPFESLMTSYIQIHGGGWRQKPGF